MSRGPAKSDFNPIQEHYRCPLQNRFGKILLNRIYKCVSFENFNKLYCYWKIKDNFLSSGWVLQLLWQHRLSFRFSTLYSPLLKSNVIYGHSHKENFRDEESMNLIPVVHLVTPDGVSNIWATNPMRLKNAWQAVKWRLKEQLRITNFVKYKNRPRNIHPDVALVVFYQIILLWCTT